MMCSAIQYCALHWSALQNSAVQCSAVQYSAVQCGAVHCSAVQCSAMQCCVHPLLQRSSVMTLLSVLHTTLVLPSHYTLHTKHCTLHTKHQTLHTAHCTQHTTHSTLNTPNCTLYSTHCPGDGFKLHTIQECSSDLTLDTAHQGDIKFDIMVLESSSFTESCNGYLTITLCGGGDQPHIFKASALWAASVERCFVSRMRDFVLQIISLQA